MEKARGIIGAAHADHATVGGKMREHRVLSTEYRVSSAALEELSARQRDPLPPLTKGGRHCVRSVARG